MTSVGLVCFVFTCMPGESYRRRLRSRLLCPLSVERSCVPLFADFYNDIMIQLMVGITWQYNSFYCDIISQHFLQYDDSMTS